MRKQKTNRELERIVKGFASHRRIQILKLLAQEPELSIIEIAERVKSDFKNVSAHVTKMAIAGLVAKRSDEQAVRHRLTKRGLLTLKFVRTLE